MLRRSLGQFLPGHQSRLDHAVDQAGDTPGGEGDVGAEPAHGQAVLGCAADVDEDVEEDERDADVLLELTTETRRSTGDACGR